MVKGGEFSIGIKRDSVPELAGFFADVIGRMTIDELISSVIEPSPVTAVVASRAGLGVFKASGMCQREEDITDRLMGLPLFVGDTLQEAAKKASDAGHDRFHWLG
jgi:hypothetical protein